MAAHRVQEHAPTLVGALCSSVVRREIYHVPVARAFRLKDDISAILSILTEEPLSTDVDGRRVSTVFHHTIGKASQRGMGQNLVRELRLVRVLGARSGVQSRDLCLSRALIRYPQQCCRREMHAIATWFAFNRSVNSQLAYRSRRRVDDS